MTSLKSWISTQGEEIQNKDWNSFMNSTRVSIFFY